MVLAKHVPDGIVDRINKNIILNRALIDVIEQRYTKRIEVAVLYWASEQFVDQLLPQTISNDQAVITTYCYSTHAVDCPNACTVH